MNRFRELLLGICYTISIMIQIGCLFYSFYSISIYEDELMIFSYLSFMLAAFVSTICCVFSVEYKNVSNRIKYTPICLLVSLGIIAIYPYLFTNSIVNYLHAHYVNYQPYNSSFIVDILIAVTEGYIILGVIASLQKMGKKMSILQIMKNTLLPPVILLSCILCVFVFLLHGKKEKTDLMYAEWAAKNQAKELAEKQRADSLLNRYSEKHMDLSFMGYRLGESYSKCEEIRERENQKGKLLGKDLSVIVESHNDTIYKISAEYTEDNKNDFEMLKAYFHDVVNLYSCKYGECSEYSTSEHGKSAYWKFKNSSIEIANYSWGKYIKMSYGKSSYHIDYYKFKIIYTDFKLKMHADSLREIEYKTKVRNDSIKRKEEYKKRLIEEEDMRKETLEYI